MSYIHMNSPVIPCAIPHCHQPGASILRSFSVCCGKENVISGLQLFFIPSVYPDYFGTPEGASNLRETDNTVTRLTLAGIVCFFELRKGLGSLSPAPNLSGVVAD